MKALCWHGICKVGIEDVPDPAILNPRDAIVRVTSTAICGSDLHLSRVEETFNDIWGAAEGRSWSRRIVLYWSVITLAPMLLIVALGLASGPHFQATRKVLEAMPFVGNLLFQLLPVVVLCVTFGLIYALMPNTKVEWRAAVVGGITGGVLFHLNNLVSVLYVSRVASNSMIYGGVGLVLVFMIGLYFSWLILLFGGQVSYAYQNRAIYLEEKQVENINQPGALKTTLSMVQRACYSFANGKATASGPRGSITSPGWTTYPFSALPPRSFRNDSMFLAIERSGVADDFTSIGNSFHAVSPTRSTSTPPDVLQKYS